MTRPGNRHFRHLAAPTRRWCDAVVDDFDMDEHHVRILALAGESWDRGQQARRILKKEGIVYLDRYGQPKARPEIAVERDSRLAFARLIRELGLDLEAPMEAPRPTAVRDFRGGVNRG